jgi:hypothetical protein
MSLTLSLEVLTKYPNKTFCETGTSRGGGVKIALDAGFERIISIEINRKLYEYVQERFNDKRIELILGNSADLLWGIIKDIPHEITFWLDGHEPYKNIPILKELDIIGQHPIKTHTILIDDVRMMGNPMWLGITKEQIIDKIQKINPAYSIIYEPTVEPTIYGDDDILVAHR